TADVTTVHVSKNRTDVCCRERTVSATLGTNHKHPEKRIEIVSVRVNVRILGHVHCLEGVENLPHVRHVASESGICHLQIRRDGTRNRPLRSSSARVVVRARGGEPPWPRVDEGNDSRVFRPKIR